MLFLFPFAALKLGQALISNIESTSNKIKGIQKLLAKAQENHDSFVDRIESMERTVKDLRNNLEAARNLFSKVAETVLGDRYRDICPEIRRDCLVEIKCWMQESLVGSYNRRASCLPSFVLATCSVSFDKLPRPVWIPAIYNILR